MLLCKFIMSSEESWTLIWDLKIVNEPSNLELGE